MEPAKLTVAVIGAGPVGLAAAAHLVFGRRDAADPGELSIRRILEHLGPEAYRSALSTGAVPHLIEGGVARLPLRLAVEGLAHAAE
jgi:hypothetical protein